jgi:GNAT superfamily N-acetyltransferase
MGTGMGTAIRSATAADVAQILAFIRALAAFEREPAAVVATEEGLLRDGFGPNPYYSCLIAEHDGQPAGFALFFYNYSTWMGRPGIYLEDLFVLPEFRGRGIGKALLQRVAAVAVEKGCQRLQWEVLDWNTPAIDFYSAMGAEFLDKWRNVRLGAEAIQWLAESAGENDLPPISATDAEKDGARSEKPHDSGLPPIRQEAGERMGHRAQEKGSAGATL